MRKLMIFAILVALSGCATVEGLGRDISGGANRVSNMIN